MSEEWYKPIGLGERLKDWFTKVGDVIKTTHFQRSVSIILFTLLMVIGFSMSRSHIRQVAYENRMTVSPTNISKNFSITGTGVSIQDQYRYGDVFAVPVIFDSFSQVSPVAHDYELFLQGTILDLPDDFRAKMIFFGQSGRGVVLIEGSFTGEPMNFYIQSNASINTNLPEVNMNDYDFTGVPLEVLEDEDFLGSGNQAYGTITINGEPVPVGVDMVLFTVNPSAENVHQTSVPITFDSPATELYSEVFAVRDRAIIRLERQQAERAKAQLVEMKDEYEARLQNVYDLTENQKQAILGANAVSVTSSGSEVDMQHMNDLLAVVNQETEQQAMADVEDLSDAEQDRLGGIEVDLTGLGGDITSTEDVVKALEQVRANFITVNRQMDLADVKLREVNEIVEEQAGNSTETNDYRIMAPF